MKKIFFSMSQKKVLPKICWSSGLRKKFFPVGSLVPDMHQPSRSLEQMPFNLDTSSRSTAGAGPKESGSSPRGLSKYGVNSPSCLPSMKIFTKLDRWSYFCDTSNEKRHRQWTVNLRLLYDKYRSAVEGWAVLFSAIVSHYQ